MIAQCRIVVAVAAVLVLAACGEDIGAPEPAEPSPDGGNDVTGPDPTEEPTDDMTDDETAQSITGTLGGDAELEGGCAWLDTREGGRYEVIWPQGYEVRIPPVELVGPDGEVVAADGDEVTVRGRPAEDMASICMVGPIFEATSVEAGG